MNGQDNPPLQPTPRRWRFGLTSRVVVLIVLFVIAIDVAIYLPILANFRTNYLKDRLAAGLTAALVFEAAPRNMIPESLAQEILASVGARTIVMKMHGTHRLLAVSDMPESIDETYDTRNAMPWESMMAACRALLAPKGRLLNVIGDAPMGGDSIEIVLPETPLKAAMRRYSIDLLLISLVMSAFLVCLAVFALNWMVLRPVRHLTSNLMDFGENPEDVTRIISPSGSTHEIGRAEQALATMQGQLVRELAQKKHLAALGLAVAKINHDLRNMLASAQLLSDRLASLQDPAVKRLAPKLISTLDRAIAFCTSTLAYGRAVERPPQLRRLVLQPVVHDAIETMNAGHAGAGPVQFANEVPADFEITADSEHMFRVLLNLMRNGSEAILNAGIADGRMTVRAAHTNSHAIIEVADNGPGVPKEKKDQLFEAFRGSSRPGGTGLGLAIAADLIRAQGGTIALLDDSPGATFRITLPNGAKKARGHANNSATSKT
ncbi:sensor histidine kinase [Methylovirgula sp. 4M-Z18]|uniref:sensor histidine kinase n=1 Tax=Methylovirgula sp. 4M-Z18 TaxID=2293567 RepID=UPI001313E29B|nr:HAMP domain-containing sensor histidine kinase [Methylovirgula sp. 4M-Z18]